MISIQKINDVKVKKIDLPKADTSKIKGYDMIPELYANIFILARKQQGKTTIISNIIKECATKETHVVFFVSTIMKDATYLRILERLQEKGIGFTCFMSMKEDKRDNLKYIIDKIKSTPLEDPKKVEEENKKKPQILNFTEDEVIKMKVRKPAKIAPKFIFVFDDISGEMKHNSTIAELVKQNRHYLSKVIISSQYVTDLAPDVRAMIDIWILLGAQSEEKLKDIYEVSDPVVEYDTFKQMYEDATSEKYRFFFINKNIGEYRRNFDTKYVFEKTGEI